MTASMHRLVPILAGLLLALALAPSASAATRSQIIKDCADDGQLQGSYTKSELRDARQNLPSDVAEYTDCADVLRRAELPDRGGVTGGDDTTADPAAAAGGGGGGPLLTPATEADQAALAEAAAEGGRPVAVDQATVVPGAGGIEPGGRSNDLPGTLVAALIVLALGGAALLVPGVRRYLPRLPLPWGGLSR